MGMSSWVDLHVDRIVRDTGAAFLFQIEDGEQVWCPRSQVADPDEYDEGDTDLDLSVSEWWARKEGVL